MELELFYLLLLCIGVGVGLISGFFGIGGGTFVVPAMLMLGFDVKNAIGISIMQMLFSSFFGSYFNYKAGMLKLNNGVIIGVGGAVGASFSGFIVSVTPDIILKLILIAILILSIIKLYIKPKQESIITPSRFVLFLVGVGVGAIAISVGVGGAIFITPILVGFLGFDIKKASSLGLFFVIFSSFSGFISMSYNGHIQHLEGFLVGIGSILGVYFGTKLAHKTDKAKLINWFLALYVVNTIILIYKIF
ncbi:sulfite exporter TauE/SafE family protein [Campylobacter majalis]|uniref:sulfite exporter TauE/SafE family protein n=1 Tax=Campylobacter majalis TaxID=2790656 RepID=UPI003D68FD90